MWQEVYQKKKITQLYTAKYHMHSLLKMKRWYCPMNVQNSMWSNMKQAKTVRSLYLPALQEKVSCPRNGHMPWATKILPEQTQDDSDSQYASEVPH